MADYNNMRKIREIYGATQKEIANAIDVDRSTVSQWENGSLKASSAKLEKLAIFYGIGPECFYELPDIDNDIRNTVIDSAKKAKAIKADEFSKQLQLPTFDDAVSRFVLAYKILMFAADDCQIDELESVYEINQQMAKRLKAFIQIRKEEESERREICEKSLREVHVPDFKS